MDAPDMVTSRFMALTACTRQLATFCLEAADYDFSAATRLYIQDVARIQFQDRPPTVEEQEKELATGSSVGMVIGLVGGVTALGMADSLFVPVGRRLFLREGCVVGGWIHDVGVDCVGDSVVDGWRRVVRHVERSTQATSSGA